MHILIIYDSVFGNTERKVAAFDTRISIEDIKSSVGRFFVRLFGYAAGPIMKGLIKKRGEPAVPPEGFFVEGTEGPLKNGELERAADWAGRIIRISGVNP